MLDDDLRSAQLLIVDDEPANVRLLERLLIQAGYIEIRGTTNPREAANLYAEIHLDSSCSTCACRTSTATR